MDSIAQKKSVHRLRCHKNAHTCGQNLIEIIKQKKRSNIEAKCIHTSDVAMLEYKFLLSKILESLYCGIKSRCTSFTVQTLKVKKKKKKNASPNRLRQSEKKTNYFLLASNLIHLKMLTHQTFLILFHCIGSIFHHNTCQRMCASYS